MTQDVQGRRILVVGLARSGFALAELLVSLGAKPVLCDMRTEIDGVDALRQLGCKVNLGTAGDALVSGVDAVIVSPAVPPDAPVVQEAARLGVPVWAELEFAARYIQGTQIAITGTNGKTTTSSLLGEMLKNMGKRAYVAGNIGLPLSAVAQQTKPGEYTVIEVSSFQLEHIEAFHPRVAALLNLTPDHLNRHGTMEAYGALKEGMLRNMGTGDFFIYNADDAFCREVAARTKAQTIPFSRTKVQKTGAWVADGKLVLDGKAICDVEELSLPGPHNLENAMAAAVMAAALSVPAPVIRHSLRTFAGVPHRMETVRVHKGVRWINDSKGTNPESSMRGVEAMKVPTILIAGGDEKGTDFAPFVQAIVANDQIQHVILIGRTAQRIADALETAGYERVTMAGEDFEHAVNVAAFKAESGGAVLLSPACASFDMFKDFEARGDRFRALVQAL